jgi:ribosomal protein S27E
MNEEVPIPTAYGTLEVVCRMCGQTNEVEVEMPAGVERQWWPVGCTDCGERTVVTVEVEGR